MDKLSEINNVCISIEPQMHNFEDELKKIINKDKNFLTPDLNNFLFSSPKRLRPRFIFLFAKILKGFIARFSADLKSNVKIDIDENSETNFIDKEFDNFALKIALITELIHNASLIHDDIIDEDDYRRENETFNKKFGSKLAVLEGDYLLASALDEISNTNLEVMKIFSQRIKKTIQGEILQNENLNKILDMKTYLNKTFNKTANLFLAGLEALFAYDKLKITDESKENKLIIKTKEIKEIKENLIKFMENYSIAFQMKNDIENFKTDKTDFKNGNYTLPMIYLMKDEDIKQADIELEKYQNNAIEYLEKIKNKENNKEIEPLIQLCKITLRS